MTDDSRNARPAEISPDSLTRIARKTVSKLRARIAEKPQQDMFGKGELWADIKGKTDRRFDTWVVLGGHAWENERALQQETLSLWVTGTNGMLASQGVA